MKKYVSPELSVSLYLANSDIMIGSEVDMDMGAILELEKQEAAQKAAQE